MACVRDGTATDAVEDLTDALDAEAERVCELAAELEALAEVLANRWARREAVRPRRFAPKKAGRLSAFAPLSQDLAIYRT